jgi:hypothetical protein
MDEYEESNATIQARHPKLFKEDTYEFEASKDLIGLILTTNGWPG